MILSAAAPAVAQDDARLHSQIQNFIQLLSDLSQAQQGLLFVPLECVQNAWYPMYHELSESQPPGDRATFENRIAPLLERLGFRADFALASIRSEECSKKYSRFYVKTLITDLGAIGETLSSGSLSK
jgi:hypothetical protein